MGRDETFFGIILLLVNFSTVDNHKPHFCHYFCRQKLPVRGRRRLLHPRVLGHRRISRKSNQPLPPSHLKLAVRERKTTRPHRIQQVPGLQTRFQMSSTKGIQAGTRVHQTKSTSQQMVQLMANGGWAWLQLGRSMIALHGMTSKKFSIHRTIALMYLGEE